MSSILQSLKKKRPHFIKKPILRNVNKAVSLMTFFILLAGGPEIQRDLPVDPDEQLS